MPARHLVLFAVLLKAACAEAKPDGSDIEALPEWELIETRRLGDVDDPDLGFSSIGAVALDDDGLLYVLERTAPEVRVYDHSGNVVRRIGRSGSGPGEFTNPMSMGLVGDTLWVTDRYATRMTLFTRSGEVIETLTPGLAVLESRPGLIIELGAGGLRRDGTLTSAWFIPKPRQPVEDSFHVPYVRLTSRGEILDTISLQPFAFSSSQSITIGGREVPAPSLPEAHPLFVPTPNGAYLIERPVGATSQRGTFTITRLRGPTDTVFRREFSYKPQPFSRSTIENLAKQYASSWARYLQLDEESLVGAARQALALPAFQPPVSSGKLASDGILWLQLHDEGSPAFEWLLIAPDGVPLATVRVPRNATLMWLGSESVWTIIRDDFSIPWLVEYRVLKRG